VQFGDAPLEGPGDDTFLFQRPNHGREEGDYIEAHAPGPGG
jgi:hypothetical protein